MLTFAICAISAILFLPVLTGAQNRRKYYPHFLSKARKLKNPKFQDAWILFFNYGKNAHFSK